MADGISGPPLPPDSPADHSLAGRVRHRLKYSPRMLPDIFWTLSSYLINALSGIFIFKIVSRWVPAQEYGQASLVLGIVGLLSQFIAGPVVLAHMRMYFEHAKEGLGRSYSRAVLSLLLRTSSLMSAIYLAVALVYFAFHNHVYVTLLLPAVLLLFVQTQLTGTFAFIEAEKRYRALTFAFSLSKALQVPYLVLLIFLAVSGPAAVVSSQVLAAASVVLFWALRTARTGESAAQPTTFTTGDIARSAARVFGWSLYLFNLFGWVLATSDRYIIEHFWTAREVGIYALNYGLWSVPYLSLNAWLEMLVRARVFERAEARDWPGVLRLLRYRTALAILVGSLITGVIYLAGKRIAFLIIGEKYWHSEALMMLICSAHVFYIVAASFHGIFQAIKKTHALMWIALVTSAINVAINFIIVPGKGIVGAGWSTFIAYAAMCAITVVVGPMVISRLKNDGGAGATPTAQ